MLVSDLYCQSCRNAKDHKPQDNEVCLSCVAMGGAGNYKESKTNIDRIRTMSVEELADYLRWHNDLYSRNGLDWLDWLKEEAE